MDAILESQSSLAHTNLKNKIFDKKTSATLRKPEAEEESKSTSPSGVYELRYSPINDLDSREISSEKDDEHSDTDVDIDQSTEISTTNNSVNDLDDEYQDDFDIEYELEELGGLASITASGYAGESYAILNNFYILDHYTQNSITNLTASSEAILDEN